MSPLEKIQFGNEHPFDAPDSWWESEAEPMPSPPPPSDWAHSAARGIIADLQDRGGIKHELTIDIEEDIRVEIVESLALIIREAAQSKS